VVDVDYTQELLSNFRQIIRNILSSILELEKVSFKLDDYASKFEEL